MSETFSDLVRIDWRNKLGKLPLGETNSLFFKSLDACLDEEGRKIDGVLGKFDHLFNNRWHKYKWAISFLGDLLNKHDRYLYGEHYKSADINTLEQLNEKILYVFSQGSEADQDYLRGAIELGYLEAITSRETPASVHPILRMSGKRMLERPDKMPVCSMSTLDNPDNFEMATITKGNGKRIKFPRPRMMAQYYAPLLSQCEREVILAISLDSRRNLIRDVLVATGKETQCQLKSFDDFFFSARVEKASKVVMIHNHSNGKPEPSGNDINLTRVAVYQAWERDVSLLDHIVIGQDESWFSFAEAGVLSCLK